MDKYIIVKLSDKHPELSQMLQDEYNRQNNTIELIASENFCSENVRLAMASCLTNKYAEGSPHNRYYGGCENVDAIEEYCQKKWQEVFNTDYYVNVQPHSGSQANYAAISAFCKPGDTILSMNLNEGGHLTHGSPVNFSGKLYNIINYSITSEGLIDYDDIKNKINEFNPRMIIVGASAYPREIDFQKIYNIICYAKKDRPIYMVDMSHIAGLIATGYHKSPFDYADVITTTTHKTLRGPRGGIIFCRPAFKRLINSAVFPGSQGGPLEHIILAKAVCAEECLTPAYGEYIGNVVHNCSAMANRFKQLGYDLVTGGTDNHLFLIDFSKTHPGLTGLAVQEELDKHHITVNKNCVPNEKWSPKETSGIRIGTAAMTTKGYTQENFIDVAEWIDKIIKELYNERPRKD